MPSLRPLLLCTITLPLALLGLAAPAYAQADDAELCAFVPPASPNGTFFDGDTVRAMAVFVRFRDDTWPGVRSWPLETDSTDLPDWAYGFFAPSPDPATFADSSLSAYFYEQTTGPSGRYTVYGDIQPQNDLGEPFLYVTEEDNSYYSTNGYGYLTQEILDYLVYEREEDLGLYNSNPQDDDVVDQVFLFVRSEDVNVYYRGCATLDGNSCGSPSVGGNPGELTYPSASQGTVRIDWRFSGSHQFGHVPLWLGEDYHLYHHNVMAHEYGHDLWAGLIGHLSPISQNNVPVEEGRQQANALMVAGAHRVDYTVSAYERTLLNWIAPQELATSQNAVAVGDLYTTGDYYEFALDNSASDRIVYVENRQRISYFDSLRVGVDEFAADQGLLEPGLLVTMSETSSSGRRDVLPVNNVLPPGLGDHIQTTTMYGPQTGESQITPWTRPNINGCTGYAEDPYCDGSGFVPSWRALDDVRYDTDGVTMLFDFYADYRTAPVVAIRADSWMGTETSGSTFPNEVRVTDGATLTVEANTEFTFLGGLTVEPGAHVVFEPGAVARLGPGIGIDLAGTATIQGTSSAPVRFERADPSEPWGTLYLKGDGSTLEHVVLDGGYKNVEVAAKNVTLRHLTSRNGWRGLSTYYAASGGRSSLTVEHALIEDHASVGAVLYHADATIHDATVRGNAQAGLWLSNADVARLEGRGPS